MHATRKSAKPIKKSRCLVTDPRLTCRHQRPQGHLGDFVRARQRFSFFEWPLALFLGPPVALRFAAVAAVSSTGEGALLIEASNRDVRGFAGEERGKGQRWETKFRRKRLYLRTNVRPCMDGLKLLSDRKVVRRLCSPPRRQVMTSTLVAQSATSRLVLCTAPALPTQASDKVHGIREPHERLRIDVRAIRRPYATPPSALAPFPEPFVLGIPKQER